MRLTRRLTRLKEYLRHITPPESPRFTMTPDERVGALRRITRSAYCWMPAGIPADPFPDLSGDKYLTTWWPWFLANGEPWPRWAQDAGFRIGHPQSVYAVTEPT
jgi:hypothetical protein